MREKTVKIIAGEFNLSFEDAALIYDNVFKAMSEAFLKGKNLNIPGFGKFTVRFKKTPEGRRVKTVKFSPVKKIAREVNKNYEDLTPVAIKKVLSLQAGIPGPEKFNHKDGDFLRGDAEGIIAPDIEEMDDNELEELIQPDDPDAPGDEKKPYVREEQPESPLEPPAEELRIPANLKELHEEISAPVMPGKEIREEAVSPERAKGPDKIFAAPGEKSKDNILNFSPVENNEKIKSFNDVFTPVNHQALNKEIRQKSEEKENEELAHISTPEVPVQSRRPEIELEVLKKLNDDINNSDQDTTAEPAFSAVEENAAGTDEEFNVFADITDAAPDSEDDRAEMPSLENENEDPFEKSIYEPADGIEEKNTDAVNPAYEEKPDPGSSDDLDAKILAELNEKISKLGAEEEAVQNSVTIPAGTASEEINKPAIPGKPSLVKADNFPVNDRDRKIYIYLMILLVIVCGLILAYGILYAGIN